MSNAAQNLAASLFRCSIKSVRSLVSTRDSLSGQPIEGAWIYTADGRGRGALALPSSSSLMLVHGSPAYRFCSADLERPAFSIDSPPSAFKCVLQRNFGDGLEITLFKYRDQMCAKSPYGILTEREHVDRVTELLDWRFESVADWSNRILRTAASSANVHANSDSTMRSDIARAFALPDIQSVTLSLYCTDPSSESEHLAIRFAPPQSSKYAVQCKFYTHDDGRVFPFISREVSDKSDLEHAVRNLVGAQNGWINQSGVTEQGSHTHFAVSTDVSQAHSTCDSIMKLSLRANELYQKTSRQSVDRGGFVSLGALLYFTSADGSLCSHIYRILPADYIALLWPTFDASVVATVRSHLIELEQFGRTCVPTPSSATGDLVPTFHIPKNPKRSFRLLQLLHMPFYVWQHIGSSVLQLVWQIHHPVPRPPLQSGGPLILVTVGAVACGKSYFAQLLQTESAGAWTRVNQDDLGSRQAVMTRARAALSQGRKIIIDRTNFDLKQRQHWFELAKDFGIPLHCIHAVWFDVPGARCASRLLSRENHPTLPADQPELALWVLDKFNGDLVPPTVEEGFGHVHLVQSDTDAMLIKNLFVNWPVFPVNDS